MSRSQIGPFPALPAALLACSLIAALLTACNGGRSGGEGRTPVRTSYHGVVLGTPLPKPAFTLTDTSGEPFDFQQETEGYLTLLFFGYTHCPDICPVHLANLAAVLDQLPPKVTDRVKVVFVTTDPERDTPAVLRAWLDHFDREFIGLTGTPDAVRAAQRAAGVAPAVKEGAGGEDYAVGHAAQVIAYTPDNLAHIVYPFGIRQAGWAADLPRLVEGWEAPS